MTELRTPARWLDSTWQESALVWADEALATLGRRRVSWSHPHVRPWSTVLRIETDADPVWLKAPGDGARPEVALLAMLAELEVPFTPRPLAVDLERAWVLLPDGGEVSRLAHGGHAPVEVMTGHLVRNAEIQRSLEPHVDALLRLGIDDLRPCALPGLLAERTHALEHERPPARLAAADAARLRAVLPAYADACAELAAGGIAPTLNHDDLHDANILARGPVIIDWGDAWQEHSDAIPGWLLEILEPELPLLPALLR